MDTKIKSQMIALLIIGVVAMTIIYATITRRLDINAGLKNENASAGWTVRFNSIDAGLSISKVGYTVIDDGASLNFSEDSTLIVLPNVLLKAPGDKATFRFKVENIGDINATVTGIVPINYRNVSWNINETFNDKQREDFLNDIKVSFTYDDGSEISIGDKLTTGSSKNLKVVVEYIKRDTPQTLPSHDVRFNNITAAIIYGQDDSK